MLDVAAYTAVVLILGLLVLMVVASARETAAQRRRYKALHGSMDRYEYWEEIRPRSSYSAPPRFIGLAVLPFFAFWAVLIITTVWGLAKLAGL